MSYTKIIAVLFLFAFAASPLRADVGAANDSRLISAEAELKFEPSEARFLIAVGFGEFRVLPAFFLPSKNHLGADASSKKYLFASVVKEKSPNALLQGLLIVNGGNGELAFRPLVDGGSEGIVRRTASLNNSLKTKELSLQKATRDEAERKSQLDRLTASIGVIADLDNLLERQVELEKLAREFDELQASRDNVIKLIGETRPTNSQNLAARENEMTGALNRLAQAERNPSALGLQGVSESSLNRAERIASLTSVREGDIDRLKMELASLQSERYQIERSIRE